MGGVFSRGGAKGSLRCGEETKEIQGKAGKGAPAMTLLEMRIKHKVDYLILGSEAGFRGCKDILPAC
jgi:hypothetical protein